MEEMKVSGQVLIWLITCLLCTAGCGSNMHNQARIEPYEASVFFADNLSARQPPLHTAPRGHSVDVEGFFTGQTAGGDPLETVPIPVTPELIEQGRTHYDIFCSPCHGQTGEGDGIIVQRGFPAPSSFHSDRLRQAPAGYYFQVINQGFGQMYSYADRIPPEDRWAIIAYIRVMQLSQTQP